MSRLAGRITFPGAQQAEKDSQPTPSSSSSTEPEWRNQRNNPRRPQRSEETSEKNSQIKPRGKGNVRYQGNYSQDRQRNFEKNERSEKTWNTERFERQEKPERFGKNERFERSERPRKPTERIENVMPTEELLEVEDIIAQISDLSIRNDRSAAQIKRNILGSADLIDTMDEDDWQKVCESMMKTALEEGEPEFISDLMVAIFKNETFSAVMSDELMAASSAHIMEEDEKPLPALLSAILCAHWPRQYAKAFDNINPILYTIVCIVKGWILVVNEDTERFYKAEKKPKYQVRRDLEEEEEEEVKSPESEEKIIEDPAIVNKCALGLSDLCDTAQRQLWVNWMSLTDEIYECIKPAITHNPNIEGSVKTRLLDTFIQMNQWTKTRQTSVRHSSVQTVRE